MSRIDNSGMGGFLNPPGHPEHNYSVKYYDGSCCLSTAAREQGDWIELEVRQEAKKLLSDWESKNSHKKPDSTWVKKTLAYFKHCYFNPDINVNGWDALHLLIDRNKDPMQHIDTHAGVHFIRKFYPKYKPKAKDFTGTWG
jgi:hypothetical protein